MALQVSEARTVDELVAACRRGGRPKFVHFWGHRARPDGQLGASCFSQWWPAPFESEGEVFASAEHYMMWRKAQLFGDAEAAAKVLEAASPGAAKTLGRSVRGFDEQVWVSHRWQIVVAASVGKFGSDPDLLTYLLGTGNRVLVEASPVDRIWGIGLTGDHEHATVPELWRGLNLLGFALMEARDRLRP